MPRSNYHFFSARDAEKYTNIGAADINLMGEVGFDFTDSSVTAELAGKGDVVVNINSPGGDYYQGLAIYNALKNHPGNVATRVLGRAASAAAIIFMAGSVRQVARHATVMIHNASGTVNGNKEYLARVMEEMGKIDAAIAEIMVENTGLTVEQISEMMVAETYINSSQAIELGFAHSVLSDSAGPTNLGGKDEPFVNFDDLLADLNDVKNLI